MFNPENGRREGDTMRKVMLLASEEMCDILRSALDDKYITLPCSDPAAGSTLLRSMPDALIFDLFLPDTDGMTFLKTNDGHLPPVIMTVTRFVSDTLLHELALLGVDCVMLTPFRLGYLESQLAELMERKAPSR